MMNVVVALQVAPTLHRHQQRRQHPLHRHHHLHLQVVALAEIWQLASRNVPLRLQFLQFVSMNAVTGVLMLPHALVEMMVLISKLAYALALQRVSLIASAVAQANSHLSLWFNFARHFLCDF
jgi:hypothetical protein